MPHRRATPVLVVALGLFVLVFPGSQRLAAVPEATEAAAVARPRYLVGSQVLGSGTAFFLKVDSQAEPVAITTAHAHELDLLAEAGELTFELGNSQQTVAVSNRFVVPPGRSFSEEGATLKDDYLAFALDHTPSHVRFLSPDPADPKTLAGQRVQLLGVPAEIAQDEDDLWGTVRQGTSEEIEVMLDVPHDLRGWGGAPVIRVPDGTVIGIVEAAYPESGTYRLGVAPIGGIVEALRTPAEGGLGIPFTRFLVEKTPGEDAEPEIAVEDALALNERAGRPAEADGPLLGQAGAMSTNLLVEIEYPHDGDYIGDPEGAFLAGRALALLGEFRRFDVLFVIDTSASTAMATGSDLNGNGVTGEDRMGGIFGNSDAGDSILAAEIMAARRVLENLDPRNTRVGLVTFNGRQPEDRNQGGTIVINMGSRRPDALTEAPLTTKYEEIEDALDHVWERGPNGSTNMTEAIRMGIRELRGFRGSLSRPDPDSEKIIMFFTDGEPTLPYQGQPRQNIRSVIRASDQASRAGVRIHSFAIGPDALSGPTATVEMAKVTGGFFTPVREPGDLVEIVENVSFANIETLEIRNATLDKPALESSSAADGSFAALIPLQTGMNELEVRAVAADGTESTSIVMVTHAPGVKSPRLPQALAAKRTQLLERRLITLKRGRIEAERNQATKARRELAIEIQQEREKAEQASEEQRRNLEIEVDEETGPDASPLEDDPR
jgi:hypothetical protein